MIAPPPPETLIGIPAAEAPITLLTGIDTVELVVVEESPIVTAATTPVPITLVFMPLAKHLIDPALAVQFSVLPAPVSADPAATLIAATSPVGYEIVHCKLVRVLLLDAVKERLKTREPPGTDDPEVKPND